MSRSPHRLRADPGEAWQRLLFGEIVRAHGGPVTVRDERDLRLPRSGRWESGLARLRPALDDALGATALAVAWRWACAEAGANAWPGLPLVARKATDAVVRVASIEPLAAFESGEQVTEQGGALRWELLLPSGVAGVGVDRAGGIDYGDVDRIAEIAAAWLEADWRRVG
jgi:hypothetical protein